MAATKMKRRKAEDLIRRLLDLVDDGYLAADRSAATALARRLEGALIALRAMDGPMISTVDTGADRSRAEKSRDS